jgi:hypothetical protein
MGVEDSLKCQVSLICAAADAFYESHFTSHILRATFYGPHSRPVLTSDNFEGFFDEGPPVGHPPNEEQNATTDIIWCFLTSDSPRGRSNKLGPAGGASVAGWLGRMTRLELLNLS